ncbi:SusC/RagA family TonB-linked outer membrane protein [Pedobacter sp. MW01-1-1]|uniref:SusC/RagA family TonB-linked outer membrane protein n=1 Tax=Pedobacter sp. MW01-1-1 TaxID=3383027 RepID=UPI003FEF5F7E
MMNTNVLYQMNYCNSKKSYQHLKKIILSVLILLFYVSANSFASKKHPPTKFTNKKNVVIQADTNRKFRSAKASFDIEGVVVDHNEDPLVGAIIKLKRTGKTVQTNGSGKFKLSNIMENDELVISFLGYITKTVRVENQKTITIFMEMSATELASVSITGSTGYQKISKERATGSYNVISGEQLDKPASNISQRLIGQTAGMQAKIDDRGDPVFEIRGKSSLSANNAPLVVLDGFPITDIRTINPKDVESVTILKDAAAASIWGARSANGVIVIQSKKAKQNTPLKINFSAFARFSGKLDLDYAVPLASSAETVEYEKNAFNKWGAYVNSGEVDDEVFLDWGLASVAMSENQLGYLTTEERDALLEKYKTQNNKEQIRNELLANPFTQQYNLSLSGSSAKMYNNLSLLYEKTQAEFKNNNASKANINYRTSADIFKWLTFDFSGMLNYNKTARNGISLDDLERIAPYEMLRDENGNLTDLNKYYKPILKRTVPTGLFPYSDWSYNPIQEIANRDYTNEEINTRIQIGLNFKLAKGLTFSTKLQHEMFNNTAKNLNNENTFYTRNRINTSTSWDQNTDELIPNLPSGSILTQTKIQNTTYNFRNQLNFDRTFSKNHAISAVIGTEIYNYVNNVTYSPTTYGYNDETLNVGRFPNGPVGTTDWLGYNQTFYYTNSYSYRTDRYFSLYANAAYTFRNKYTLSGSARTDASNLITDDPKYRYAPFWSLGGRWQIHQESFMDNVKWVDQLSVRATYGYNGNVDKSTSFLPLISMGTRPNIYTGDVTASISSFGNPLLRWEKTRSIDFGIDYSLFKRKLYGKIDFYNRSGKDLMANAQISSVNGTTNQRINNAEMYNRGVELEIGSTQNIKANDIIWNGSLNFSYNQNKITKLLVKNYTTTDLLQDGHAFVEGENANALWRYTYGGIQGDQPGVMSKDGRFLNFNQAFPGDGRNYLTNMGTAVAPYSLGFTNSFKIYDFNLSFIITGKFGHKFQRLGFNYPMLEDLKVLPNNKLTEVLNGDPSKIVPLPLNDDEQRYYRWSAFSNYMNYLIVNAANIRMQEVNLTYSFPAKVLSKINMSRLSLYAQGNNLFVIKANKFGEDPEFPMGTIKPRAAFTLGLNATF